MKKYRVHFLVAAAVALPVIAFLLLVAGRGYAQTPPEFHIVVTVGTTQVQVSADPYWAGASCRVGDVIVSLDASGRALVSNEAIGPGEHFARCTRNPGEGSSNSVCFTVSPATPTSPSPQPSPLPPQPTNCPDSDGDGISDCWDNCQFVPNPDQADFNVNGVGDACEDSDGDGVLDSLDNCRTTPNSDQADFNANGVGDACEDTDGDGILDCTDRCPAVPGPLNGCPLPPIPSNGPCSIASDLDHHYFLNVREGPSTDYPLITSLNPEHIYPIQAQTVYQGELWYLVDAFGYTGWVSDLAYRRIGGDCTSMPTVPWPPIQAPLTPTWTPFPPEEAFENCSADLIARAERLPGFRLDIIYAADGNLCAALQDYLDQFAAYDVFETPVDQLMPTIQEYMFDQCPEKVPGFLILMDRIEDVAGGRPLQALNGALTFENACSFADDITHFLGVSELGLEVYIPICIENVAESRVQAIRATLDELDISPDDLDDRCALITAVNQLGTLSEEQVSVYRALAADPDFCPFQALQVIRAMTAQAEDFSKVVNLPPDDLASIARDVLENPDNPKNRPDPDTVRAVLADHQVPAELRDRLLECYFDEGAEEVILAVSGYLDSLSSSEWAVLLHTTGDLCQVIKYYVRTGYVNPHPPPEPTDGPISPPQHAAILLGKNGEDEPVNVYLIDHGVAWQLTNSPDDVVSAALYWWPLQRLAFLVETSDADGDQYSLRLADVGPLIEAAPEDWRQIMGQHPSYEVTIVADNLQFDADVPSRMTWLSDGYTLVVTMRDEYNLSNLYALELSEAGPVEPTLWLQNASNPAISEDGRFLVFERGDPGWRSVYVTAVVDGQPQLRPQLLHAEENQDCFMPAPGPVPITNKIYFICDDGGDRVLYVYDPTVAPEPRPVFSGSEIAPEITRRYQLTLGPIDSIAPGPVEDGYLAFADETTSYLVENLGNGQSRRIAPMDFGIAYATDIAWVMQEGNP